jgi:hypothetical protein
MTSRLGKALNKAARRNAGKKVEPESPRSKEIPTPEQRAKEVEELFTPTPFNQRVLPPREGVDGEILKST